MKSLIMVIGLTLASTIVVAADSSATAAYVGNADQGKSKSVTCAGCHGADGNSAVADYPKLSGQHSTYLQSTLKAYRDGSRANAIMAGFAAALSDEDIADLAAYFSAQTPSTGAVEADLVARGQQLYRFGDSAKGISACAACHGPTGAGVAEKRKISTEIRGKKSIYYLGGLTEGFETFAFLVLVCLFPGAFWWMAIVFGLLAWITAVIRVIAGWQMFK